jgi:hypothetical protein
MKVGGKSKIVRVWEVVGDAELKSFTNGVVGVIAVANDAPNTFAVVHKRSDVGHANVFEVYLLVGEPAFASIVLKSFRADETTAVSFKNGGRNPGARGASKFTRMPFDVANPASNAF